MKAEVNVSSGREKRDVVNLQVIVNLRIQCPWHFT